MYIEGRVAWITTGINSPGNKCDCIVLNGDLIETITKDYCCSTALLQQGRLLNPLLRVYTSR